jgi:hypothetical protein
MRDKMAIIGKEEQKRTEENRREHRPQTQTIHYHTRDHPERYPTLNCQLLSFPVCDCRFALSYPSTRRKHKHTQKRQKERKQERERKTLNNTKEEEGRKREKVTDQSLWIP